MKEYIIKVDENKKDIMGNCPLVEKPKELIRCRNCKHRDPEDHKCDCGHDIQWQLPREDDWFCADGVAKDINVPGKEGR